MVHHVNFRGKGKSRESGRKKVGSREEGRKIRGI